jgi:hypothetical protein
LYPHTQLLSQDLLIPPESLDREALVMAVARDVIQLAPPEVFLKAKESLPTSLVTAYLADQEHFDLDCYAKLTSLDTLAPSNEGILQSAVSAVLFRYEKERRFVCCNVQALMVWCCLLQSCEEIGGVHSRNRAGGRGRFYKL